MEKQGSLGVIGLASIAMPILGHGIKPDFTSQSDDG